MSQIPIVIGLHQDFHKNCDQVSHDIKGKLLDAISKFMSNPNSPGLQFKRLEKAVDRRLYSLRLGRGIRAIVLRADQGRTYLALYANFRNAAYAWAERRRAIIAPETKQILFPEVTSLEEFSLPSWSIPQKPDTKGLFVALSDPQLKELGASESQIEEIRCIRTLADLDAPSWSFSESLYDALCSIAIRITDGEPLNSPKPEVPASYQEALKAESNHEDFVTLTEDEALQANLDVPLSQWRIFLHPTQRQVVEADYDGPALVYGSAGTGKTVVALHRAQHLASKLKDHERILFTTFTITLIEDTKRRLHTLCSFDEIQKIQVKHLDAWCREFLQSLGYDHAMTYENPELRDQCWKAAFARVPDLKKEEKGFLMEEWEKLIQTEGILTLSDYLSISRKHRPPLSLEKLTLFWPVFETLRSEMEKVKLWEPADMFRTARFLIESEVVPRPFSSILVDEVQDFHSEALRLVRAMVPKQPNDLFLAGDDHQNIYGHRVVLSQLGIHTDGRKIRLCLNYRTSNETRRWAMNVLKGQTVSDLDGGVDCPEQDSSILFGPDPEEVASESEEAKLESLISWYQRVRETSSSAIACVSVRTVLMRDTLEKQLEAAGIPLRILTADCMDIKDPIPLRLATIHRVKGLEFDHMCILGYSPHRIERHTEERQRIERCTYHVAATRARVSLYIIRSVVSPPGIEPRFRV